MNLSEITRRNFLYLLFSTLVLKDVGLLINNSPPGRRSNEEGEMNTELLSEIFSERSSAVIVGQAYLRQQPPHLKPIDPVKDLLEDMPELLALIENRSREHILKILHLKHQDDYSTGRVVSVQGWLLSKTEARLCAVAAQS